MFQQYIFVSYEYITAVFPLHIRRKYKIGILILHVTHVFSDICEKIFNHMNLKHLIATMLSAGLLLASCSGKKAEYAPDYCPLLIAGRIYGYGQTDADRLNNSEHIGVYVSESGSDIPLYSNLGYSATYGSRDDYFQPDDIGNIPHLPLEGDGKWDVSAYYPYNPSLDGHIVVVVSDQSSVTANTLLYARVRGLDRNSNTAYMHLSPALCRLVFRFKAGNDVTEGQVEGISVKLTGIPARGYFNPVSMHFTVREDSETTITAVRAEAPSGGAECEVSAFIIPQADTRDYVAEISVPGENAPRSCNLSEALRSFSRGTEYTFDITVNKRDMDVRTGSAPIAGWDEDGSTGIRGEEKE